MESQLAAKHAITEVIYNYCRAIDRLDQALGKSVWHPGGTADYGILFKGTGEEFVAQMFPLNGTWTGSQHQISNILIEIDGDQAGSESYVTLHAWNMSDTGDIALWVGKGRYCDRWSYRNGGWAIDHRHFVLDLFYSTEPARIAGMEPISMDRNPKVVEGQRGTTDPSYLVLKGMTTKR